ncbi:Na+/H+ antiporter subunit E [Micromonospora sp. WMMD1082]|uniref:Na+/H+ antiporter subunit E n=1 Tax=Micromonospora sp. WMMD1082 TaxID=3016104 RepID=UPI002416CB56|nr:Na+/H+ antiporter subunit E [Micromonospora sp. WMMD1082]MDG4796548.1 Na+/H+ antiporter subunit E [Micromonospora sp. WMMD1082]
MSTVSGTARRALVRTGRILRFAGYFVVRLAQANLVVAWEILTPGSRLIPGVVRVPLRAVTDIEVAAVALAVNLIPGTLTLRVTRQPAELSVHGMYAADPVAFRHEVTELEWRLLAALRPADHPEGNAADGDPAGGDPAGGGGGPRWRWRWR